MGDLGLRTLRAVVEREVVGLLEVEGDTVAGEVRPLRRVPVCRRDGPEDVCELRRAGTGRVVQVGVEFAEVARVEGRVEHCGAGW